MSQRETRSMTKKKEIERVNDNERKKGGDSKNISSPKDSERTPSSKGSKTSSKGSSTQTAVSNSGIILAKKKAELAAAKKIAEIQKSLVEKELEVEIAELSAFEELDEDQSTSTVSRNEHVEKWIRSQHDQNEPVSASKCDSDIKLLAREIRGLRRPFNERDLHFFSGNVYEWLCFKAAYEDTKTHLSHTENVARLRRCLKGDAHDAVKSLLHSHAPPNEIMQALELRFGRPELILNEEIRALKELPKLNDSTEHLTKFACKIRNCVATIKALEKPEHLHNLELVQILKSKMPQLKSRWLTYARENETDSEPELVKLSVFLEQEAQATSKFWLTEPLRYSYTAKPTSTQKTYYTGNDGHDGYSGLDAHDRHDGRDDHNRYDEDDEPDNCCSASNPRRPHEDNTKCRYCDSDGHIHLQECENFKKLSIDERWNWAKDARLCFKCLRSRHYRENCRAKTCGINGCRMSHSRLLHAFTHPSDSKSAVTTVSESTNTEERYADKTETTASSQDIPRNRALLKIVPVKIHGPNGCKKTYALLDGGSTLTLLKESLAHDIGITGEIEPLILAGVNSTSQELNSRKINFVITGPSHKIIELNGVRTVQKLSLTPQTVAEMSKYDHLRDLPMDHLCYEDATPELLIGQDNWHAIITKQVRSGKRDEPVASLTDLGWVIHGFSQSITKTVHFVGHSDAKKNDDIHKLVEEYFKIDSMGICKQKKLSEEDERAIEILHSSAKRIDDGKKWEVGLLWRKDHPILPDSHGNAKKRLRSIEKKMDSDIKYKQKYKENIDNFVNSGYAAPCDPIESPKKWYLPHFGVTNVNKPGKLRIVHDAACKVQGTSLNDNLLTGPDLLRPLTDIIFKFREGRIAVSADVKEMFLQIRIRSEDRPAQRFLWREFDRTGPMKEFEMKSVIFGATCSPATAIYIKNKNADDFVEQWPEAVESIKNRFYMDDYLESFHSEEKAIKMVKEVSHINSEGGFTLTQWMSNNENVMKSIDEDKKGSGGVNLDFNVIVKILDLRWNPVDDTLGFNLTFSKIPTDLVNGTKRPTKREALKVIMSLFDPLGLLTPITTQGKILLQQIWKTGIDWDHEILDTEMGLWYRWVKFLTTSYTCRIPRCYDVNALESCIELHVFCDASEKAFATVAYWRFISLDGVVRISLIAGKSRVAPSIPISIPRLELQAAVLGARLADSIIGNHDALKASKRFFWSDSSAVIAWIRGDPRNYKTYVSNRLGEIAQLTKSSEWRWLPTNSNVADDATRQIDHLRTSDRWFTGPQFLYECENSWPIQNTSNNIPVKQMEVKNTTCTVTLIQPPITCLPDIERFSKWLRLMKSTAYMLTFIERIRHKAPVVMQTRHLDAAEELWIKHSQAESFYSDISLLRSERMLEKSSRLFKLSAYIDERDLLRLRGRANATSEVNQYLLEPVILDGKHPYTKLLIQHYHEQTQHGNCETVVNQLRQKYWVIHLRPSVKYAERTCQLCRVRRAKPCRPPVGDLPPCRLAHHQRPFSHCGLDYFGPMLVSIGRRREKRYGALFTCLTTRAVHMEIAGSLTTDSAVLAIRRMMARRGCPKAIYSDNGTNLRGANTELRKAVQELDSAGLREFMLIRRIEWHFIPPVTPHMGGCWERLVQSIKKALISTLSENIPSEEVLLTLLIEAEHTVNSRPLTYVSVHPDDEEAITPNHFLLGSSSGVPVPGIFNDSDLMGRKQWRKAQRLADVFWSRWMREYLPTLLPRSSAGRDHADLKTGDVVIIYDQSLPRNVWPKGVVERVYPGPDGRVRVAEVRTAAGILKRPAVKLIKLKIDQAQNGSA